ncbi:hypothetical protein M885DRAFT_528664 [Pelagophyceae sp. CCMP2097]|nr:hypothetical protein M885DRAFT_528664 [Pelagophyceae sp. CCMP2097]
MMTAEFGGGQQARPIQYQNNHARGFGQLDEPAVSDYDWVINKLRARGFKTLQDRKAEAEAARQARTIAWEQEKQRRADDGEDMRDKTVMDSKDDPSWWHDLKALPGAEKKTTDFTPQDTLTDEQREEKKIRDKWGGTLADNFPLSDLKIIADKGYIPRSQATCFRCGEKGHWSRDCPSNTRQAPSDDILDRDRGGLGTRDRRTYDKALGSKREDAHFNRDRR